MATTLNLPLEWETEDGYDFHPLSALVVVHGIDSEGQETHAIICSEGLSPVAALGMASYAKLHSEESIRRSLLNYEE